METKLPKYLAGFSKNHNTQHALLKIIETWHAMLNNGNKIGVIVMDLSKAFFDTLNHNLLCCKMKANVFDANALTFIQSFFSNRHQRVRVCDKFSKWQKRPLLFNIFINDLFLFIKTTTLCNSADDITIYMEQNIQWTM